MSKTALAAALILGSVSAAEANTVTYTFANLWGWPYCDGIQLSETGGVASGTHLGVSCTEGAYAGGFQGPLPLTSSNNWIIATNDYYLTDSYVEVFTIDQNYRTWTVWLESSSSGITFEEVNLGFLLNGKVPAKAGTTGHTPAALGRTAGR